MLQRTACGSQQRLCDCRVVIYIDKLYSAALNAMEEQLRRIHNHTLHLSLQSRAVVLCIKSTICCLTDSCSHTLSRDTQRVSV